MHQSPALSPFIHPTLAFYFLRFAHPSAIGVLERPPPEDGHTHTHAHTHTHTHTAVPLYLRDSMATLHYVKRFHVSRVM